MTKSSIWTSWNGRISRSYDSLVSVSDENTLSDTIRAARQIRMLGTGRSSADICAGTTTLVEQTQFNKILGIDTDGVVTAQPGILLSDLIQGLALAGRCIPCLPDIDCITLGGAIATGSHGTGRDGLSLSDYLLGCRLVRADGSVDDLGPQHPELDAVRVSLGLFGAFSTLRLRTEPLWHIAVQENAVRDSEWMKQWPEWLGRYDFLRLLWLPHTGYAWAIRGNRYEEQPPFTEKMPPFWQGQRRAVSDRLYRTSWRNPWETVFANRVMRTLFFAGNVRRLGSLYDATVTKTRGSILELAEWTIPLSRFDACFRELRARMGRLCTNERAHIPMDIRFIRKSSAWLGNSCEGDSVTVGCVSRTPEHADSYAAFRAVEETFLAHGGRPHWAKHFDAERDTLRSLYPRWDDFIALRRRHDPSGKFLNLWLESRFQ